MKTIIFDFDGTIADTFHLFKKLILDNLDKIGVDNILDEEIERLRSTNIKYILNKYEIGWFKFLRLARFFKKKFAENASNAEFFEGMQEVLAQLKAQGYSIGLLSSNSKEAIDLFLEKNAASTSFDFVVTDVGMFGKARSIRKVLNKHNIGKDEAIYVGDEVRDIEGSKQAGVRVIAVTWGFNYRDVIELHKPTWIAEKPEDILLIAGNLS